MKNPISWCKLKVFNHVLNNFSDKEIAKVIKSYGVKEFGKDCDEYLDVVRRKTAGITFEISRLMEGENG